MTYKLTIPSRGGAYPVVIGRGLDQGALVSGVHPACRALIVSDENVFPLYGARVRESLAARGFDAYGYAFAHGERSKTLSTVGDILNFLAENEFTRGDIIVAIGGGVVGDLAGFAAAVYMRGIGYVQLPTTLLAAVDSSVGGKTGVDLPSGKNLAGAFHSPLGVFCDTALLETLPEAMFADGYAEAVKSAMIGDPDLFSALRETELSEVIYRCVSVKGGIVTRDETETGERQFLNFGHTVGHAVEALSGYAVTHGSAVAIGMAKITRLAEMYGLSEPGCAGALVDLLRYYGLPTECEYSDEAVAHLIRRDKKRRGGYISFIIPRAVGKMEIIKVETERVEDFLGGKYIP